MCCRNILIKNRKFTILIFISMFLLCYIDMKSVGVTHTEEAMIFRLLSQQIFLIFLLPLHMLSVLNQKFIRIQKNYMILYTNDELLTIRQLTGLMLVTEVSFYTLGQVLLQFGNYVLTGQVYLKQFWFNLITIIEIIAMVYIIIALLLTLRNDLFVFTVYYALILLLLIYNKGYVTIPMTIKSINLINDAAFKLFLSKVVWAFVAFICFRAALTLYRNCFYEE